jgi:hypothetical protein
MLLCLLLETHHCRFFQLSLAHTTISEDLLKDAYNLGLLDLPPSSNHKKRMRQVLADNINERQERQERFREHRRNNRWADFMDKSNNVNGYFVRRYMMSETTFYRLVGILNLPVNETKSSNSTGGIDMISPDIIVASRLRWLGGDDMKAIEDTFHISLPSAQRIVNWFLDDVIDCDHKDCAVELPKDDELEVIAQEWDKLSSAGGSMFGCVLAIDGFLSPRTKPDAERPNDYYTDSAAVDHCGRFRFKAVVTPGGTNDARAYLRCDKLTEWIAHLREIENEKYYGIADKAFPLSNQLQWWPIQRQLQLLPLPAPDPSRNGIWKAHQKVWTVATKDEMQSGNTKQGTPSGSKTAQLHHQHGWCTGRTANATQCQQPIGSCSSCGQWDRAIARWHGSKRNHCS